MFNINLDKKGNSKIRDSLNTCLAQNYLVDAWRIKHPHEERFTWQRLNPTKCKFTLNYWFIPTLLEKK